MRVNCRSMQLSVVLLLIAASMAPAQDDLPNVELTDEQRAEQLAERDRLAREANRYLRDGAVEEAMSRAAELLNIERDVFGALQQLGLNWAGWLAATHERREELEAARTLRAEVLAGRIQQFGESHWRVTDARLAMEHVDLLLELTEEQRRDLAEADALRQRMEQLYAQARYAEVTPLAIQVLDAHRNTFGEMHRETATSLNNLGVLYESMHDYALAEPLYQRSLEISQEIMGEEHPHAATSLNNLGGLYMLMGDYVRAEPLYQQALEIRRNVIGEDHADTAQSLNNLGVLHASMGDYTRAEPLYRQALEIRLNVLGEQHRSTAGNLNDLGALYESMGDDTQAEPLYQQALEINRFLGEQHPDTGLSLKKLGTFYQSMGDYAQAEPLLQQAIEIYRNVLGEEHLDTANSLNSLALLYHLMGDSERAEPLYRQVLEISRAVMGEEHRDIATALNNLGGLYASLGDYARAEPLYQHALEIDRNSLGEKHPHTATSLNNLGRLYRSMGDDARAEPLHREALNVIGELLEATSVILSERQQLAMAETLRYQLDAYASLASSSDGMHERAFRQVLLWKGATLVRQRAMRLVADEEDVADLFSELQSVTMRLASLSRAYPANPEQEDRWRGQITDLSAEKERLEARLSRESATFREAQEEVTLEDLLVSLPEDAVLVDFLEYRKSTPPREPGDDWTYKRSLVAFVVKPGDTPVVMFDLGPVAPLREAVDTWRNTFGMSRQGLTAGRQLRESIWEPLLKDIGDAELVLVSVDGFLGRLPLSALPGREPGTFLLEDHRLAVIPVPQLLPALVNDLGRPEFSRELLLMGDVDYDADPQSEADTEEEQQRLRPWERRRNTSLVRGEDELFGPLAATAGEIAAIERLYTTLYDVDPDAIVMLDQARATEAQFRAAAPHCYQLHIATHGFFADPDRRSPLTSDDNHGDRGLLVIDQGDTLRGFSPGLLSGLAFAGANRPPQPDQDDGILTAEEIAFLRLENVDLVTLSACETGLGAVAGGEGLIGVQRAFQVAGARTTVASLWKVDDHATRVLMEKFYRNSWEHEMTRLDALREAQLWVLRHPDDVRAGDDARRGAGRVINPVDGAESTSPFYWAAFTLSGDWR